MNSKEYQNRWMKKDVITDIKYWGKVLLDHGINPTFVCEGLNKKGV